MVNHVGVAVAHDARSGHTSPCSKSTSNCRIVAFKFKCQYPPYSLLSHIFCFSIPQLGEGCLGVLLGLCARGLVRFPLSRVLSLSASGSMLCRYNIKHVTSPKSSEKISIEDCRLLFALRCRMGCNGDNLSRQLCTRISLTFAFLFVEISSSSRIRSM